jgi:hypothetical protein
LLTITPSQVDLERGLESWDWICFNDLKPILVSSFGDIFFESPTGIQFLDTIEGKLKRIASDRSDLQKQLSTVQGEDEFLLAGLVFAARERLHLCLQPGECYDFKVPPVLSGAISPENLQKMSFVVKLNICGQIHKQVKDLTPGTKIGALKFSDT